jgi:mono/diheme cytochrome c family protein
MYSNGIRVAEESFLSKKGILEVADWVKWQGSKEPSKEELGHRVFRVECSTCHTYRGVKGIFRKTRGWSGETIFNFISSYKYTHPYMPPFVGTEGESEALAFFIYNNKKKLN